MISKKLTFLTLAAAAGLGALAFNVELASAGGWGGYGGAIHRYRMAGLDPAMQSEKLDLWEPFESGCPAKGQA